MQLELQNVLEWPSKPATKSDRLLGIDGNHKGFQVNAIDDFLNTSPGEGLSPTLNVGSKIQPVYVEKGNIMECKSESGAIPNTICRRDNNGASEFNSVSTVMGFFQTSDRRKKKVTGKVDGVRALKNIKRIQKVYYQLISNPGTDEIGLLAQEVKKVYPEIVKTDENGYLSVDYTKLAVICMAAIDALDEKIENILKLI